MVVFLTLKMADRGKIKLLREKLSLNEGITKRQQEKLAQVSIIYVFTPFKKVLLLLLFF